MFYFAETVPRNSIDLGHQDDPWLPSCRWLPLWNSWFYRCGCDTAPEQGPRRGTRGHTVGESAGRGDAKPLRRDLSNSPTSRGGIKGEWEMVMEISSVSLGQSLRSQREKWVLRKQIQAVLDTILSTGLAGRKHFILSTPFIHSSMQPFILQICMYSQVPVAHLIEVKKTNTIPTSS